MKSDPLYQKFMQKWDEVTELPPQTIGPFTPMFKRTAPYFKVAPWRVLIPLSFLFAVGIALVFEMTTVQLVSLLQRGF